MHRSSVALARDGRSIEPVRFKTTSGTTETYRSVVNFEPRMPDIGGPIAIERYLEAGEKGRLSATTSIRASFSGAWKIYFIR